MIKTDLSGFVVTMHSGLCEQYEIDFLFCTRPRALWQQTPPELVFILQSKLRVTGLCEGNSPVTGEFPAQRAIDTENGSNWWRHRAACIFYGPVMHA